MQAITVLVPVFCHAKWLESALNSIFNQTCFSEISVLIGDDCSIDNSLEIAHRATKNYPNVKVFANKENLGILGNYKALLKHVETEYVSILEGDDFWCSPEKLSRQYEFMRANPDANGCFVEYYVFHEETGMPFSAPSWSMGRQRKLSTLELLASNPSSSFSTCMYKTEAFRRSFHQVESIHAADWIVNILVSANSCFGFVPGPAAVYRVHSKGSWTGMSSQEKKRLQYDSLDAALEHLPPAYASFVREHMNAVISEVA